MTPTRPRVRVPPVLLAFALAMWLPTALAHGGGGGGIETRFALPAWVPWVTGAGVVALSFVAVCAFLTRNVTTSSTLPAADARADAFSPLGKAFAFLFASLYLLAIVPLFIPRTTSLVPSTLLWVVMWGVLPLIAYLVANPWARANPFLLLAPIANRIRGERIPRAYPERLAAWPAVIFIVALTGIEVAARWSPGPRVLAAGFLAYLAFTFTGIIIYGAKAWLARAEVFTILLRMWGALGPWGGPKGRWFRTPAEGLRELPVPNASHVALIVAMLYGVNFDGFLATRAGNALFLRLADLVPDRLAFVVLLLAGYAAFLGAFWACAHGIRRTALSLEPVGIIARRFAASLLPIAAGYHLAHNLFYLAEAVPRVLLVAADPLGLDLVQAASTWRIPVGLGAAVAASQLALIVGGHIFAVAAAHRLAFDGFTSRVQAIQSEFPLTLVMIFYTLIGLWILTSPGITGVLAG